MNNVIRVICLATGPFILSGALAFAAAGYGFMAVVLAFISGVVIMVGFR